jgi:gliding motility-associated-like protein
MVRYLIVLFLILFTNFSFSQRTVILTQTQNDATKGIDRKAWQGLGNVILHSDGYANDFTLPARINPCEKITNVKVDVIFSGYTKVGTCPHFETYFNIFYGCTTYAGGATCPLANVISETPYPVNTNPATRNFAIGDFGGNLSVDIIPVSNPGCNPVTNGELTHNFTTTVTVTIAEDLPTTPTFTQVAPICIGGSLSALPTTSNNGISGTWAPALDNTATTTYTFTPNSDECATSTTMTIVVNSVTLVIADPAPVCAPSTVNLALPAITAGSDSGTLTYWTDAAATIALVNPNAVSVSNTYYIKNTVSGCFTIRPVLATIGLNTLSPPTVTTPVYLCQNSPGVPLTATASAGSTLIWYGINPVGGIGSPTAPTPSTLTPGATTYYVSQTNGICESSRSAIVVNVVADNGATILGLRCDPSQIPPADINTSVFFDWSNNVLINDNSYNYSYTIQGGPPVTGTRIVSNLPLIGLLLPGQSATITLTATRFPCVPPQTVTCTVPCVTTTTPNFAPIAPFCTGTLAPVLLNTSPNNITGTWSPALVSNTTSGSYTFTPDPILFPCALTQTLVITVDPLVTPAFTTIPVFVCQGAPAPVLPLTSSNAIIGTWSPAAVNTSVLGPVTYTFTPNPGQCASATLTTVSINIVPVIAPNFALIPNVCSGSTAPILATTSPNGITGTWLPATISNTIGGNYVFTPTAGQCSSTQTLPVVITPKITPTFTPISAICSGSVLAPLPTTSNNGVTGTWFPATISNTTSGSYLFTPNATECATTATMTITVNPNVTPLFNPVPAVCSGAIMTPLPTTSTNGITGTWAPALNNLATTTYTFTPTAGLCATFTTLTISVNPIVAPNFAPIPNVCSGSTAPILATTSPNGIVGTWSPAIISNTTNGSYTFTPAAGQCSTAQTLNVTITPRVVTNFAVIPAFCSGTVAPILAPMSPNGVSGTWSPATISNTTSGSYLFTPNPTECATTQTLNVVVNPLITPDFVDIPLCSGTVAPILPAISPNGITGTWSPSTINNTTSGAYVFTPNAPQCATSKTINVTVNPSNTLVSISWTVTDAFSKNQIVTVTATAAGNYLYQMDSGPFQTSPVFENVSSGLHSITVIDANGCSAPITDNNVLVIGYPKYFTPNGDGYNDIWNITSLSDQLNTRIYIFDRYGKLLKDISPNGSGWDGTYIGQPMPADDYWFTVEYVEQSIVKKYKSHFSLKR